MSLFKDKIELGLEETEFVVEQKLKTFPPFVTWLIIVGVLGTIPAYFIAKNISHTYWQARLKPNVLVAKQSFENPKDLEISNSVIFSEPNGSYAAYVEVTNPNLNVSLAPINYTLDFLNQSGDIIGTYPDTLFLLPNQKKYLVAPKIIAAEPIASVKLELPPKLPWQNRLSIPKISLVTSLPDTSVELNPLAFVAQGSVTNNSAYSLKQVRLVFLVYNSDGKIISVGQRDEFTFSPFERRSYKQLWPNLYAPAGTTVKVLADTNVLDPSNIQITQEAPTSASDLSRPTAGHGQ